MAERSQCTPLRSHRHLCAAQFHRVQTVIPTSIPLLSPARACGAAGDTRRTRVQSKVLPARRHHGAGRRLRQPSAMTVYRRQFIDARSRADLDVNHAVFADDRSTSTTSLRDREFPWRQQHCNSPGFDSEFQSRRKPRQDCRVRLEAPSQSQRSQRGSAVFAMTEHARVDNRGADTLWVLLAAIPQRPTGELSTAPAVTETTPESYPNQARSMRLMPPVDPARSRTLRDGND